MKRLLPWRRRRPEDHLAFGARGERSAVKTLRRAGHRILRRNYRCLAGEIDLITTDADELVFVEVKTRTSDKQQDLVDTVSLGKWRRVERAARFYLKSHVRGNPPCRFDQVTVLWDGDGKPRIEHIVDAYQARRP